MADLISKVVRSAHRVTFEVNTSNQTIHSITLANNTENRDNTSSTDRIQSYVSRLDSEKGEVQLTRSETLPGDITCDTNLMSMKRSNTAGPEIFSRRTRRAQE